MDPPGPAAALAGRGGWGCYHVTLQLCARTAEVQLHPGDSGSAISEWGLISERYPNRQLFLRIPGEVGSGLDTSSPNLLFRGRGQEKAASGLLAFSPGLFPLSSLASLPIHPRNTLPLKRQT